MPTVHGSLHVARVHQYAALMNGTRSSPLHGDCLNPVGIEYRGGRDETLHRLARWHDETIDFAPGYGLVGEWGPSSRTTASLTVRCRKCPRCLKHRARLWATRGQLELLAADRSWFGTMTVSPDNRFIARLKADAYNAKRSVAWNTLSGDDQFKEIARVLRRELQLFLKRVRKQSGARIRYLVTCEAHKDGFPHLHMLLHEYDGRVTKRTLEQHWHQGLSHWRLVNAHDHKVPWYVAKYLTKSILAKPVASLRYGRPPLEVLTEAGSRRRDGEAARETIPVKET